MHANRHVEAWVDEMVDLCRPSDVHWCDGSEAERASLVEEGLSTGELIELDGDLRPGCVLHRSDPDDVARTEGATFICTPEEADAGPTNNWMAPAEAYEKLGGMFRGVMEGRTMYVVPFLMGPPGASHSKVGVELTDSLYVALNMRIMTRMGEVALRHLGESDDFTKGLHSVADLDPEKRHICHFPADDTIWSIHSGYGGNALLGKKCLALRLASWHGRREGWMAEHMMIAGVERPDGEVFWVAGAFPSACGKTNLSMLVPPEGYEDWRIWTLGDDIAWLFVGEDGRLRAQNPEAGFFGVAPGTSRETNPNAMETIARNTIFTNVARTPSGDVWWEGKGDPPARATDWQGEEWTPASDGPAAHPNARFTAPVRQCPNSTDAWDDPRGVPISAILFGARMTDRVPLVFESFSWQHGTYLGATLESEQTAAADDGEVGRIRRDPMAMLPFCGYHMADYFGHWLSMEERLTRPPKIFRVNWFRRDEEGSFLWPGFGQNIRVLRWIIERCEGEAPAEETPIGRVPTLDGVDREGLEVDDATMRELLAVDRDGWVGSLPREGAFLDGFGERLPDGIRAEHEALKARLGE